MHRTDCSVSLLPYQFNEDHRSIGFLVEKELRILNLLKNNPEQPFLAIIGGGKIEDKVPLINGLLQNVNIILLCPAICFSFLKSLANPIGLSLVTDKVIPECRQIMRKAQNNNIHYQFPIDYQVAYNTVHGPLSVVAASEFPSNAIGISIGPRTTDKFIVEINRAKTIFLNCAMGFADQPKTRQSTYDLIKAMANTSAMTVIAGGDSVDAAIHSGAAPSISHLSTGGGAALAYLSNSLLPGLTTFEEQ
jgi:phosphoglycerate kinase